MNYFCYNIKIDIFFVQLISDRYTFSKIYCLITDVGLTFPKPEEVVLKSSILSDKTKDEVGDLCSTSSPLQPPKPVDPLEELRWGENMVLVGDTFWRSFLR